MEEDTGSLLVFFSRSHTSSFLATCYFLKLYGKKNVHIHQLLIIPNYISTQPSGSFICLFIPMFHFHYLFNFSSFSQTVNQSLPPPGASHLSPCIFPSFSCSSACRSLFILCLLRFPLIPSLHLSLRWLCAEYKPRSERMSCDIVFNLFTVIIVSCYLAYACFNWAWQELIDILSMDRRTSPTASFSVRTISQIDNNDPTLFPSIAYSHSNS